MSIQRTVSETARGTNKKECISFELLSGFTAGHGRFERADPIRRSLPATGVLRHGADGKSGKDGVGISKAEINAAGELVLSYTDGTTVNLGKVVGADGKDGLTPFIGENGHWWIGEADTGVSAAADSAAPASSDSVCVTSPVLIVIGFVAGLALLGNIGLILYIVLKKKKAPFDTIS